MHILNYNNKRLKAQLFTSVTLMFLSSFIYLQIITLRAQFFNITRSLGIINYNKLSNLIANLPGKQSGFCCSLSLHNNLSILCTTDSLSCRVIPHTAGGKVLVLCCEMSSASLTFVSPSLSLSISLSLYVCVCMTLRDTTLLKKLYRKENT